MLGSIPLTLLLAAGGGVLLLAVALLGITLAERAQRTRHRLSSRETAELSRPAEGSRAPRHHA